MARFNKLMVNIRLSELSGLANRMAKFYAEQDLTDFEDYAAFTAQLAENAARLSEAFKNQKIISELGELDRQRDDAFRSVFFLVQGSSYSPEQSISQAANVVMSCLEKYGMETIRMSHDGESGNISSFLKDLSKTELSQQTALIPSLDLSIELLTEAQNRFATKQNEYNEARQRMRSSQQTASSYKTIILGLINDRIVNYHTALADMKGDAFWEMAIAVNQMIIEENRLTKSRMHAT